MKSMKDLLDGKVIKVQCNVAGLCFGRRNFNNLEEAQQLFGKRFALSSRKYSEAGKQY
jgi:hypothetical protein